MRTFEQIKIDVVDASKKKERREMTSFQKFIITLIIAAVALVAEFVFHSPTAAFWIVGITGTLLALSLFAGMVETLKSGSYGVDILAITAIIATLAVGEYWASLVVLIMLTGGDSLEEYASRQASKDLRALLNNSPSIAHKLVQGKIADLAIDDVAVGDVLLVRPGEIVPVDGIIQSGTSLFDESSLTGESMPIEKTVHDEIMSGSVNGDNAIHYRVTKNAKNSQYQKIIKLVKASQERPAKFVRLADRYAVPFTISAYIIGGLAWYLSKDPVRFAQVLVVASPCPLILAAPIAFVAGMNRASRNGIVVKTGTTIEQLADGQTIAFDKTGTITQGILAVDDVVPVGKITKDKLMQLVASAEQESAHIIGRSLFLYSKAHNMQLLPVSALNEVTGSGIEAVVDGKKMKIGKAGFVKAKKAQQKDEQTIIYVAIDGVYAGYVTFKDLVRREAHATIEQIKDLGIANILMLTGDKRAIAEKIAQEVDISQVYAECLPEDKLNVLQKIPKEGHPVVMIGDGINDAPALALADVGIAMGARGSSAASESADVVILKDSVERVAAAIKISRETMSIAKESVLIGLFICIGLMLIAATGIIPTLVGAALQEVVDTVSILSALRAKND